jgi:hypothetical protein
MTRRYRTPYHEDFDDLDAAPRRGYQPPTRAGLNALISMLVSLGLLALITILGIVADQAGSLQGSGLLVVGILLLDFIVFATSLTALILGLRAQNPANTLYRGYGLAGVIGGIVCLLASLLIGLASMCVSLFIAAVHNIPGG